MIKSKKKAYPNHVFIFVSVNCRYCCTKGKIVCRFFYILLLFNPISHAYKDYGFRQLRTFFVLRKIIHSSRFFSDFSLPAGEDFYSEESYEKNTVYKLDNNT